MSVLSDLKPTWAESLVLGAIVLIGADEGRKIHRVRQGSQAENPPASELLQVPIEEKIAGIELVDESNEPQNTELEEGKP